jgi:4-amino-4-deoxy-L-arabinose transferase-like glycosyltransferase
MSRRSADRLLLPVALALVALALRVIGARTAYELHIDETTYTELSRTVANGGGVTLFGAPFFLHPPLFFLTFGGFLRLIGDHGPPFDVIHILDLRWAPAVIGAGTCAALVVLVRRVAGTGPAVVAGLVYALDPFVIRFDSRIFLEAMTLFWVVCGLLVLCRPPAPSVRRGLAAGVLFGLAVLTKDTAAFVTVLPLVVVAIASPRWRRPALAAVGVAIAMYAVYLLVVLGVGDIDQWFDAKGSGFLRLLGLRQDTGYNRPGSVSFVTTLKRNVPLYGITYLFIAAGTLAALDQLRLRRERPDVELVLAVAQLCSVAQLAYGLAFGTIEEQMFYFLAVLSVPTFAIVAARRFAGRWRLALVAAGVFWLAAAGTSWAILRTEPDDAYREVAEHVADGDFDGRRMAVSEDVAQFVLRGVDVVPFRSVAQLDRDHVDYALVSTRLVRDGLGSASPDDLLWLRHHATLVYQARGRTVGALQIYRLPEAGR